jgi:phage-related protein
VKRVQPLVVRFFRTRTGAEPVRDWLKSLPQLDRKALGDAIRTVQLGWPLGMPVVRKLDSDLWEIRVRLADRIARVLFTRLDHELILLHSFIKNRNEHRGTTWRSRDSGCASC